MGKDDIQKELEKLKRKIAKLDKKTQERSRSRSKKRPKKTRSRSRHKRHLRSQSQSPVRSQSKRPSRSRSRTVQTPEIPTPVEEIQTSNAEPEPETSTQNVIPEVIEIDIDADILSAMGTVEEDIITGPPVHLEIVQRWTPILNKGLKKEEKTLLLNQYVPFNNIPSMIPPKLNPELSAAVTDPVKKRDNIIEYRQKNVAAALTAIGSGLHCFLTKGDKMEGIKNFHDAGKMLCDVFHSDTQSRRQLIQNVVNKNMKESLQGDPDDLLFGKGLTERIKSTKAVQKSAQDLSKVTAKPVVKKSLNYRGPPPHLQKYKRNTGYKSKENRWGGEKQKPYKKPPAPTADKSLQQRNRK